MRREAVIRSLILYLGEKAEELFEDCLVKQRYIFEYTVTNLTYLMKLELNNSDEVQSQKLNWVFKAIVFSLHYKGAKALMAERNIYQGAMICVLQQSCTMFYKWITSVGFNKVKFFHFVFFSFPLFPWGSQECCRFLSPQGITGLTGAKSSFTHGRRPGYTLNESPAHCRTLTATQGANCTSGEILGFSILLKDTSTCSSVPATFWSLVHSSTHWATAALSITQSDNFYRALFIHRNVAQSALHN